MKKFLFILIVISSMVFSLFAQSSQVRAANKKTAERCLKLSESNILAGDWQNAFNQAEMGISYDESISDLYYVKAAAMSNLDYSRREIIGVVENAFEKNNWINYNENHARVLYADLLSDTKNYDKAISVLDYAPYVYSADAEFIRIKTYYRMGTDASLQQARSRLNSARKIYPADSRFPYLFFLFETLFLNYSEARGDIYEIPENVKTIAESYILKFPDYDNPSIDMEVMALLFSEGELQSRVLKAVGEKNEGTPLFAYAALRSGIISEEKAYNQFFLYSDGNYSLYLLECFTRLITDPDLKENLKERLASFSENLFVDTDLDLLNELTIKYERGRPQYVYYDSDCDEVLELSSDMDFGTPQKIIFDNLGVKLEYDLFPFVKKVSLNNKTFSFLNSDFEYTPFIMQADSVFKACGAEFYIPYVNENLLAFDEYQLVELCSSLELPVSERNSAKVNYSVFQGRPVYASFSDSSSRYAYCTIEPGCPFVRYVDYDGDGIFETAETFDIDYDHEFTSQENLRTIKSIFGENSFGQELYLSKVEIDRDENTIIEFRESYLRGNGVITAWDENQDGILDCEYLRWPDSDGILREENTFYSADGMKKISVLYENKLPSLVTVEGNQVKVQKGAADNFYWIGEMGTPVQELLLLKQSAALENATVALAVEEETSVRLSVIKVDSFIFGRVLPPSNLPEETTEKSAENSEPEVAEIKE